MQAAAGRDGPVDQALADHLGDVHASRELGLHDRRRGRGLEDIGVGNHDDPAGLDPELHGGADDDPRGRGPGAELRPEVAVEAAASR